MKFIGDLHIHSHYSRATSRDLTPEYLDHWAALKGIKIVGTGDFTHPGWLKELKEKLEPAEPGLFSLKDEYRPDTLSRPVPPSCAGNGVRFLLTAEISNIYKKNGKVRKVHNVIFAPDLEAAEKLQRALAGIGGNITSDGRPILGMDSRDLLEMALDSSDRILFVPAHIWTPWFSALGDKSGFDTIEECFADLSHHIHAVETGLSTDPPMHWMCSFLDKYTLVSNSDAHSPEKLGRNANLFDTELSYDAVTDAIRTGDPGRFLGTIDLFPQEGKYHYDGHRKCGICWDPVETLRHNGICPVCNKKVTIGVMNRVVKLSDRQDLTRRKNRLPFLSIIPLKEILSEILETGPASKKVSRAYDSLLRKTGPELDILLDLPVDEIKKTGNEVLSEAIRRMRNREIYIKEGFDGEYGRITVFGEHEARSFSLGESLFKDLVREKPSQRQGRKMLNFDLDEYRRLEKVRSRENPDADSAAGPAAPLKGLNPEQKKAAEHLSGPALIIAGPGTGKTRTLAHRIAGLIRTGTASPGNILAVTFTNKAANEIKERLKVLLKGERVVTGTHVSTFHALGFSILKEFNEKTGRDKRFIIMDEEDKRLLLRRRAGCLKDRVGNISNAITAAKQNLRSANEIEDRDLAGIFDRYETILKELNAFDLDDLICWPVRLLNLYPEILASCREKYRWIMVDEYQDINFAQYQMIRKLMPGPGSNLCVIGDPNQAIYGFRGADVKFIGKFIDDYPGAAVYTFRKSYRCSDRILRASDNVIQSRTSRTGPLEGLRKGVKIKIVHTGSDKSEAEFVARTIEGMIGGLRFFSMDSSITGGNEEPEIKSLSDFAVLCRMKEQMKVLEKAFNDHGIPYQTVGNSPFFRQEPARSVIGLLRSSMNPEEGSPKDEPVIGDGSVRDAISAIIDNRSSGKKPEDEALFQKLLDLADDFGDDLEGFLKFTALGAGVDTYRPGMENVALMTLHAAKGLEFKCVFIVGCENGLLPYSLFKTRESDPEEEKRLFYVGMTRAKEFLFLSRAEKRFLFGREYCLKRSPYLDSIEKELIESSKAGREKTGKKEDIQMTLFDTK
ncbi:MAG: UvrD-helicase domain-containing protein [Candidatus Omnitrophota bacterium]|nr:UvrD-helicase domain-containing protein [Candidatus Omnitrophota bacterium]